MELTDKDLKALMIEALDYNSQVVAMCTAWFGKTDTKRNTDKFIKEYKKLAKISMERRKEILGIEEE